MPTFRVKARNVFITLTQIKQNFNHPDGDKLVQDLFADNLETLPFFAIERSAKSNEHMHILFCLSKATQITRKTFQPLCDYFGTNALNI